MSETGPRAEETRRLLLYTETVDLHLGAFDCYGEVLYRRDLPPTLFGLHRTDEGPTIVAPTIAAARRYRNALQRSWPGAYERRLVADRDLWASAEEAVRARAGIVWGWTSQWLIHTAEAERYLARYAGSIDDLEDDLELYRIADLREPVAVPLSSLAAREWMERIYRARIVDGWDLPTAESLIAP